MESFSHSSIFSVSIIIVHKDFIFHLVVVLVANNAHCNMSSELKVESLALASLLHAFIEFNLFMVAISPVK